MHKPKDPHSGVSDLNLVVLVSGSTWSTRLTRTTQTASVNRACYEAGKRLARGAPVSAYRSGTGRGETGPI
jgi:hypothetical protein